MRANGWRGATRARRTARTTEPDPPATRAPGHGPRRWRAAAPSLLVGADFTYAPMVARFGYTAFAVDADAALIAGWEVLALPKNPASSSPLRHAAAFPPTTTVPGRDPSFRCRGQYTAIHYGDTLMLAAPYKAEWIRDGSPFRKGLLSQVRGHSFVIDATASVSFAVEPRPSFRPACG